MNEVFRPIPEIPKDISLEQRDGEEQQIKERAEAKEAWDERVEEYEARNNRDVVGEVVDEAREEAEKAEALAAKKTAKATKALANTLTFARNLLINTPIAVYDAFKTGAEDLTHDASDALLGTTVTDTMKGWWKNMFGKQNAEIRIDASEQHRGVREMLGVEVTTFGAIWDSFSRIPSDIAQRLDEWSPESMQKNTELARQMEETAWIKRNETLIALEAEEKKIRFALEAEEKKIRSAGLSGDELAEALQRIQDKKAEALQRIQDKKDVADMDYNETVQQGKAIAPDIGGAFVKGSLWWATRGVPKSMLAFIPDAANYFALDGLITEMAQGLGKGLRQERRKAHAEKKPNAPYSQDVSATWGPQERAMDTIERLGDALAGIGDLFREAKAEHAEAVQAEARTVAKKEANIYQDAMSGRIEALTKKAKLTAEDKGEIGYLTAKLARARKGLAGADELAATIKRAEAFTKRAEAKRDDENLLMGYLAGRAINVIRGLDTINKKEASAIILALQEDPSPRNLRHAEALVYAHLDRELKGPAETLLTNEQKAKLQEAHEVLKDSVSRVTETYKNGLAGLTKELTKGLQAADKEMKKAAVQAEQAHDEERLAA